jgi:arylsulfatase A-like enzyme
VLQGGPPGTGGSVGRTRRVIALSVAVLVALGLAACARYVTHESGSLAYPEYDGVDQAGGASYTASQDHAYAGSWAAKARFEGNTTTESHGRGNFNVNAPNGYTGYYGAAFYFPSGTFTGPSPTLKGTIDILRWDNRSTDPSSDYGGIKISGSDRQARLVRGNFGTSAEEEIGSPFGLQEGCWNWLLVRQKLSNQPSGDPGHAINEVFLNGYKVVDSTAPNSYGTAGAKQVRVGMVGIAEVAQDVPLQYYVDNAYVSSGGSSVPAPLSNACKPNVLMIVTDDQPVGTMDAMPKTLKWLRDGGTAGGQPVTGGTEFSNAYVTTPLCCPSRSSIMTGRYAHNHGVKQNPPIPQGGGPHPTVAAIQNSTLERYLQADGYRTGMIGKFLNGWPLNVDPPYFDSSAMFTETYCPFRVKEKGVPISNHGSNPVGTEPNDYCVGEYSTDFMAQEGMDFIQQSESDDTKPWYLYVAPHAPHELPLPESDYSVDNYPRSQLPSFQFNPGHSETALGDKPSWVQQWTDARQLFDQTVNQEVKEGLYTRMLRTLKSVDDLVDGVMNKLVETGEDQNTLVFFISDNGYQFREHGDASTEHYVDPTAPQAQPVGVGLSSKGKPYPESTKVPMFVRWPANPEVKTNFVDQGPVANVDVAPTVMNAAHVAPNTVGGDPAMDGKLLINRSTNRARRLTEGWSVGNDNPPPWASITTSTYQYIEYYMADEDDPQTPAVDESKAVTFHEFYDLTTDPYELDNIYPPTNPSPAALAATLAADRGCQASSCP